MTKTKSTKRALLLSALSLLMCVSMLIGSTFAWFTDSVTSAGNTIQSGTLDVDLVDADNNSKAGKVIEFVTADNRGQDAILWEPGCTYKTEPVYVVNKGNLALKYEIVISGINGNAKLLEAIEWTVTVGTTTTALADLKGDLLAGAKSEAIVLSGHMKEEAGNEYQGLTADGISVSVFATQDTVENDSFDNQYDKNASYPVASAAEMKEALANGGIVSVNKDIKTDNIGDNVADRITISQPTTLNLDAKIISPDDMGNNSKNFCALIVDADTTINAGENGGIDTGRNGGYALNVRKGANLTITGGSYYGGGTAVQVQDGTLTITGGHFAVEAFGEPYGYNFLLNCVDSAYKNGSAKIIVKGGTFVNFDPSNNTAEGAGTNFVADGYKVVSASQTNDEVWYTVVPE